MSKILLQKPIFTINQLNRLSNIFDNAGQVILGVAVLSPLIVSLDRINWLVEICGIISSIGSWLISVKLAEKGSDL